MTVRIDALDTTTLMPLQPITWSKLDATLTFNTAGSFTLTLPPTDRNWQLIAFDAQGEFKPVILYADWNGVYQFLLLAEQWGHDLSVDNDTGIVTETLTLTGADLLALLANRVCFRDGTAAWTAQLTTARTVGPAPAETVIKTLVSENTVSAGDTARRIPNFTVAADAGRGGTASYAITPPVPDTGSGTTQNATLGPSLMDMIRSVAAQSLIGVTVTLAGGQLVFDCYVPRDLTAAAVFAPQLGNLRTDSVSDAAPTADVALLQSGAASGAFTEHDASGDAAADPLRRAEQYSDQTSTTTASDLTQAYTDLLTQGASVHQLAVTVADGPMLRFGYDVPPVQGYLLGDTVTVAIRDGVTYSDIVSQVELAADATSDPYTETVTPTIGNAYGSGTDQTATSQLAARVRAIDQAIGRLRKAGQ